MRSRFVVLALVAVAIVVIGVAYDPIMDLVFIDRDGIGDQLGE